MSAHRARGEAIAAVLEAAERLLVTEGHLALTTRRVAEEAGINHGLIHYYFGSMEEVMLQTLEGFTARLTERQRALYAADVPFIDKWRSAMRYLTDDIESGYEKIWFELQSVGWNMPEVRKRVAAVFGEWHDILMPAFDLGLEELGIDRQRFPTAAIVSLVMTFNVGIAVERLSGFDSGHTELLAMVDTAFEAAAAATAGAGAGAKRRSRLG